MARTTQEVVNRIAVNRLGRLLRCENKGDMTVTIALHNQPWLSRPPKYASALEWLQAEMIEHGVIETAEELPSWPSHAALKRAVKFCIDNGTIVKAKNQFYGRAVRYCLPANFSKY